jgi:alanyl-tRNA synthetase
VIKENIIPEIDTTTQFVCSGMQDFKEKFRNKTKEKISTIQSCVRLKDIDLWGDGTHYCHFRMLGCFSFGNNDYEQVFDMWLNILKELNLEPEEIHYHPDSGHSLFLFQKGNYKFVEDIDCIWTEGSIGGHCVEFYINGIEIGNLVNTNGDSVDVGFGLERLVKLMDKKSSSYTETEDLETFLTKCWNLQISPGQKGIHFTVRKVFRKWLEQPNRKQEVCFQPWIDNHEKIINDSIRQWLKLLHKPVHRDKNNEWWKNTTGFTREELAKKVGFTDE